VRAYHRTWYRDLVTGLPEIDSGYISVGREPGHGVELHPDLAAKFTVGARTTALEDL
jgi:L-alanine-DL-glutamate epimerase-like enolase superfamily enzyme